MFCEHLIKQQDLRFVSIILRFAIHFMPLAVKVVYKFGMTEIVF